MTTPNSSDGSIYQAAAAQSTEPTIMLQSFWLNVAEEIRKMTAEDFRTSELPLARIKKIMKMDEDVKMISAEAPVLFAKAAEIFVAELTLRAWIHTEDNKRRTLQRNDIAMAITKYDQFDFLIDIVPREELKPQKANETSAPKTSMYPEQVQYYFQLQQPQNQQQTPATTNGNQGTGLQVSQVIGQQALNTVALAPQPQQQQQIALAAPSGGDNQNQHSVIQLQQQQSQQNTPQVFHQVVGANGEIQNIPIQLTPAQLQAIQAQMQGKQTNQATVLQTGDQSGQVQFVQQQGTVFQLPQQQTFLTQDSNSNQDGDGDGDENEQQLTIMAEPASKT